MTAISVKANRRARDFYPTPAWATERLLSEFQISGTILECCAGEQHMAAVLRAAKNTIVYTNDINPIVRADSCADVSQLSGWENLPPVDWVVTNPPFNEAPRIVPLAYDHARVGIAMLLRLSFLEPCLNRRSFLTNHPPTSLLVLPRISFTGDRKTDSVTTAWLVWRKGTIDQSILF